MTAALARPMPAHDRVAVDNDDGLPPHGQRPRQRGPELPIVIGERDTAVGPSIDRELMPQRHILQAQVLPRPRGRPQRCQ